MVAPLSAGVSDAGLPLFAINVLPLAAFIAIFTTMLVGKTNSARVLWALAERDLFPSAFAATSERTNVPYVALYVVAIATAVVVIGKQVGGGIVLIALMGMVLPYTSNIVSLVGLRVYRTDVSPPFHAPGGLFTASIALCFLVLLAAGLSVDHIVVSLLTITALLAGFAPSMLSKIFARERGAVATSRTRRFGWTTVERAISKSCFLATSQCGNGFSPWRQRDVSRVR